LFKFSGEVHVFPKLPTAALKPCFKIISDEIEGLILKLTEKLTGWSGVLTDMLTQKSLQKMLSNGFYHSFFSKLDLLQQFLCELNFVFVFLAKLI